MNRRSLASICTSGITGGHQQQGLVDFISQSLSGRNAACQNAHWLNDSVSAGAPYNRHYDPARQQQSYNPAVGLNGGDDLKIDRRSVGGSFVGDMDDVARFRHWFSPLKNRFRRAFMAFVKEWRS